MRSVSIPSLILKMNKKLKRLGPVTLHGFLSPLKFAHFGLRTQMEL